MSLPIQYFSNRTWNNLFIIEKVRGTIGIIDEWTDIWRFNGTTNDKYETTMSVSCELLVRHDFCSGGEWFRSSSAIILVKWLKLAIVRSAKFKRWRVSMKWLSRKWVWKFSAPSFCQIIVWVKWQVSEITKFKKWCAIHFETIECEVINF